VPGDGSRSDRIPSRQQSLVRSGCILPVVWMGATFGRVVTVQTGPGRGSIYDDDTRIVVASPRTERISRQLSLTEQGFDILDDPFRHAKSVDA
jgi:hypothetical protein